MLTILKKNGLQLGKRENLVVLLYGFVLVSSLLASWFYRYLDQSLLALTFPVLLIVLFNRQSFQALSSRMSLPGLALLGSFAFIILVVQADHLGDIKMWRLSVAFFAMTLLFGCSNTARMHQAFYQIALILVCLLALVTIVDFPQQLDGRYRLRDPFHHNQIGVLTGYLIPFAALCDRVSQKKRLFIVSALLLFCVLSKSRKSLLAIGLYSFFLVFRPWDDEGKFHFRPLLYAIVALCLLLPFASDIYERFLLAGRRIEDITTLNSRLIIWRNYLQEIFSDPLTGKGFDDAALNMKVVLGGSISNIAHAHNLFLAAARTHGVVFAGFCALVMAFAVVVHGLRMISSSCPAHVRRMSSACFMISCNGIVQSMGHVEVLYPDCLWGTIMWATVVLACTSRDALAEDLLAIDPGMLRGSSELLPAGTPLSGRAS